MKKRIYFFLGTTAELIKVAPIIKELRNRKIEFKIISSGQSNIQFQEVRPYIGPLKADIEFSYKGSKPSLLPFIIWAIRAFGNCIVGLRKEFRNVNQNNSYLIVHGDTTSSLIGAMIAKIYHHKLVHIESGLRSYNFLEPFPEELCRFIVSHLADIHFCPNKWSVENLKNCHGLKVNTMHNTLIESFFMAMKSKDISKKTLKNPKKYYILVLHRQEHVIFNNRSTREILQFIMNNTPKDMQCILIMHDLTARFIKKFIPVQNMSKNIIYLPRLPYISFVKLLKGAEYIMTDGGSNQEEASYLGKPCLLLRRRTERIEGLNQNVVLSKNAISVIRTFMKNYKSFKRKKITITYSPSKIIMDTLVDNKLFSYGKK